MNGEYESYIKDLRCPNQIRELFAKLEVNEVVPVDSYNSLVFKCDWCTRQARKTDDSVKRILHHFNLMGDYIESSVERK